MIPDIFANFLMGIGLIFSNPNLAKWMLENDHTALLFYLNYQLFLMKRENEGTKDL